MSDQEIINAIDARIDATLFRISQIGSNSDTASAMEARLSEYIDGLSFARALIVKRMEASK